MLTSRKVTVFGGTGFLGRRVVQHLLDHGFEVRAASRHPERGAQVFRNRSSRLEVVRADVGDDRSVIGAVADAFAVVNAVSLYVERGSDTFRSVHVEAAARVAQYSRGSGVQRLAHVSGIGADAQSHSSYIRSRGEGESAVRAAFSETTIIRPGVMFGPDDAFLIPLMKMLRMFPVFPMFGRGQTALQPAYVEDVAEAIARCFDAPEPGMTYELAGPHTYTYKELLQTICNYLHIRRVLTPMPITVWKMLAVAGEFLPASPVTSNQVELMTKDNVASGRHPGFDTLGIEPRDIEIVLAPARRGD
ncbi:complex I NDUFA9 subunit family protein [Bradyrhizobium sp. RDT10]